MSTSSSEMNDKQNLGYSRVKSLSEAGFSAPKRMLEFWDMPLIEYLRNSIPPRYPKSFPQPRSRILLARSLFDPDSEMEEEDRNSKIEAFLRGPILQLGSHAHLLFDESVFINQLFHNVMARENNHRYLFVQLCGVLRCIMNAKEDKGPCYLELIGDTYQILQGTRKFFIHSHFAALGEAEFIFAPTGKKAPLYSHQPLPSILESLKGIKFGTAEDAFVFANSAIWETLKVKERKKTFFYGENLTSQCLINHLGDPESPIFKILMNPVTMQAFLAEKSNAISEETNRLLADSTDLFWFKVKNKLHPVKIKCNSSGIVLVDRVSGKHLPFIYTPEGLSNALRDKIIFADLILSYMVLSVFPKVMALGGSSQHEYLPQIQRMLGKIQKKSQFLPQAEVDELVDANLSRFTHSFLLELSPFERNFIYGLNENSEIDLFEKEILSRPISATCGTMARFEYLARLV